VGEVDSVLVDYPGIMLQAVRPAKNPHYLFVDLMFMDACPPGEIPIRLYRNGRAMVWKYPVYARDPDKHRMMGLGSEDFIYLIMPDRFANGKKRNDIVKGMRETTLDRGEMYARHGGDLQGIADHLDYLEDLGVTAIWLNPVQENDMPRTSYHGYAATDLYTIDPRLGNNEDYRELVEKAHAHGIKVIMDVVHNHVGSEHWFVKDPPMPNWLHNWPTFTKTNYRASVMVDPHASEYDRKRFEKGWFVESMPDLNQDNQFVANYLIQNNIWWIEYAGVDGFRLDTYTYSSPSFLERWGEELQKEYPELGTFGETWVNALHIQDYFQRSYKVPVDFNGNLKGVTDFQLFWAITKGLNEPFGWTEGLSRVYYTLTGDYLLEHPENNVIFLDNHDASRFYSVVGEDLRKFKMGIALLMTLRGIPCLYYGTEILMKGFSNPDGLVRGDFPGGWKKDKVNKFTAAGRTAEEEEAFQYIRTLANWRKNSKPVREGKLMQFVPQDGIYVYFRYTDQQAVMVVLNQNEEEKLVDCSPYGERMQGYSRARNVVTGEMINNLGTLRVPPMSALVLDLMP